MVRGAWLCGNLRGCVVQVLEASGAVRRRVGACRHHGATERRRARAAMCKVSGLDLWKGVGVRAEVRGLG